MCRTEGRELTVVGLEVSVDDGDDGPVVKVQHPAGDLHRPVDQNVRRDPSSGQSSAQRAAGRVLHDQAQVGLLQANALERDDVGVLEHGEEPGLVLDALGRDADVLVRILTGRFHRHHLALPGPSVDLPEPADPDDLLQTQVAEVHRLQLARSQDRALQLTVSTRLEGDVVGGEDSHLVVDLPSPPSFVSGYLRIQGQNLH